MPIFDKIDYDDHEQIVFCSDRRSELKAIIAIHNTRLGPALGGCRMWPYATEEEALTDVLRLSKGMTYKIAAANVNFGGGKAVIIGDPKKIGSEVLFRAFGRFVQGLGGRYITAEDAGTNTQFMEWVRYETKYVSGTPIYLGGSGDPSPFTTRGIFVGIKAALKKVTGSESLENIKVAIHGVGNVGYRLCKELRKVGAKLYVNDIVSEKMQRAAKEFGATIVSEEDIFKLDVDVYAPCALGATINDKTIPLFRCPIIAGAANNQLTEETKHSEALQKAGILYAPDYIINAGGMISCACELTGGGKEYVLNQIDKIYDSLLQVFAIADREKITTAFAAQKIAEARLQNIPSIRNIYLASDAAK